MIVCVTLVHGLCTFLFVTYVHQAFLSIENYMQISMKRCTTIIEGWPQPIHFSWWCSVLLQCAVLLQWAVLLWFMGPIMHCLVSYRHVLCVGDLPPLFMMNWSARLECIFISITLLADWPDISICPTYMYMYGFDSSNRTIFFMILFSQWCPTFQS